MGWKDHLKWGFIVIMILTAVLFFMSFTAYGDVLEQMLWAESEWKVMEYNVPILLIAFIFGLYGSLFPDTDIGTSKIFRLNYIILIGLAMYSLWTGLIIATFICLGLMAIIVNLKHRGMLHSMITGIILGVVFSVIFGGWYDGWLIGLYFIVGFATHLGCDRGD